MNEIVERKFAGDKVTLDFIRNGKKMTREITLKTFPAAAMYAIQYGKKPRYTVQGGLVFQPLDLNLYSAHKLNNPRVRRLFANYTKEGTYKTRKDIVILTRVLEDPINSDISGYAGNAVESINGTKITDLDHAHRLLNPETLPEFFVIRLDGIPRPLILPTKELSSANSRISQSYSVHKNYQLKP